MSSRLFATVALAAASTLPLATVVAQCGTQWIGSGGVPGVASRSYFAGENERIDGTGLWDPDGTGPATARLVMVGFFELAGTVISPKIAAWDPATGAWSAIAPVTIDAIGQLSCVLGLPNGDLLVGGYFTTFNGTPMRGIARWSGGVWSPLGAGLDGEVKSIVRLANGDLIATGSFSASGTVPVASIARWDGVAWSPLGSGLTRATGIGLGRALGVLPNGDVVVGGTFTMAGGVAAGNIARWNGATWAALGAGLPPLTTAHGVHCLAVAPNGDVVAGGFFTTAGGAAASYLARWNGSAWSGVGGAINNIVRSATFAANGDLYVGGSFMRVGGQPTNRVARWDGSVWSTLADGVTPTTPNSAVNALTALPGGDVVLAGQFVAAGGAMHLARWNGTALEPLSPGTNNVILASSSFANGDLVVAGEFTTIDGVAAQRIARRTAAGWVPLGPGLPGTVRAVVGLPNGDLVATGAFSVVGGVTVNGIARWDGVAWSAMGSGLGSVWDNYALAVMPNGDIVVGGAFAAAGGVPVNNIARWNGTTWSPLGSGVVGYVNALAVMPNGDLVAGGGFTTAGGVTVNHIARWNGSSWSPFGPGFSAFYIPSVSALLPLANGQLVAAGRFQTAGGVAVNGIARWTGTNWTALGTGLDPLPGTAFTWDVLALAVLPNGHIVMGGGFTSVSGVPARNIARWNGTSWSAVGGGLDSNVNELVLMPSGEIVAGGMFLAANGVASPYLAYLGSTCPATAAAFGSGCTGSAGPNTLTATALPWLGATCRAVATGCPANAVVVAAFGFGTVTQPLASLLPQGVAGCSLLVTPDLLVTVLPSGGAATIDLAIPNVASLIGGVVNVQALPFEFGASGLQAVTSGNALALASGTF